MAGLWQGYGDVRATWLPCVIHASRTYVKVVYPLHSAAFAVAEYVVAEIW